MPKTKVGPESVLAKLVKAGLLRDRPTLTFRRGDLKVGTRVQNIRSKRIGLVAKIPFKWNVVVLVESKEALWSLENVRILP